MLCAGLVESQVKNVETIEVLLVLRTLLDHGLYAEGTKIAEMLSVLVNLLNGLTNKATSGTHS